MKKFFAGLAAVVLLPLVLLCGCAFLLPAQFSKTYLAGLQDKIDLLRETPGQRILIIGGSSVPFSLRSDLLKETFPDYAPVDFGLYADLGLPAMLDLAEPHLHEGDIVIISPEQNEGSLSCRVNGEDLLQAADGDFALLKDLSPKRFGSVLAAIPTFGGQKLRYFLTSAPVAEGVYRRDAFSAFGDMAAVRPANILPGGYDPNDPISFAADLIDPTFIEELNGFAARAEAAGASVYYRFPPMNKAALAPDTDRARIDGCYDALAAQLTFSILGDPSRSILESGWFYDTNYHLNDSGAVLFTRLLMDDLKLLFHDPAPSGIGVPAMPDLSAAGLASADPAADLGAADRGCFTCEPCDGGLLVTGLSPEGQQKEHLTVPLYAEGLPVLGVAEGAFRNCPNLRTVTLQENITLLQDGMFEGCTKLTALVLRSSDPTVYAVGRDLRRGASFTIRVPEGAYGAYAVNYSWQAYATYITEE